MANSLYTAVKKKILDQDGGLDFAADTIKVSLIDTADYTVNIGTHDFYDDVSAGVEETATLASKTTTGGVFDSADVTFTAAAGDPCEAFILWSDTGGAASTDPVIAYFDTSTGLPVTLNGGDVGITVNASGWFYL
jgi:hypothetical protein